MTKEEQQKDDIETMKILFNADINELWNQRRFNNAREMEGIRDRIIQALEQQPSEPRTNLAETSQDCISRQAVIDFIIDNYGVGFNSLTNGIRDYLPPVTPKRPKGKWIRVVDKAGHWVWECEDCKWQQRIATNFCPDCGAEMGGTDETN